MTSGTRPDWENVGIEFRTETQALGKELLQKIRALPAVEQVSQFMPLLSGAFKPVLKALVELMEDEEAREDLLPRFREAMGHELLVEFVGQDGQSHGYAISTKDTPPYFQMEQKKREPNAFGIQVLFRDILDFIESCLAEGRIVVPDILDFYCRGKMQLIMLKKRPEWTGMSLFGGLMFYAPRAWAIMDKNDALARAFREVQGLYI